MIDSTVRKLPALLALAAVTSFAVAQNSLKGELPNREPVSLEHVSLSPDNTFAGRRDQLLDVFVRFTDPSVAEQVLAEREAGRTPPGRSAQIAHFQRLGAVHNTMRGKLQALDVKIDASLKVAVNGMRVKATPVQINEILRIAGVRSVSRVVHYLPDLADSVPWIGAPEVWNTLGVRGEGVTVGVIDTGIDYYHANFEGTGNPADFAADDPNIVEPDSFPTAKVIGGFDFVGTAFDASDPANNTPLPDPDPLDENFHGSHVAGAIAGVGTAFVGPGVAPMAKLYALKVFGASGSTNVVADAIDRALDPNQDGALDDRLDIINMSLGSPLGDPASPSALAAENAAALGMIVVASAGNSGDVPYVTGSPAVAPRAISVAASIPGNRLTPELQIAAPPEIAGNFGAVEGAGPVLLAATGPLSGDVVPGAPLDGCTPLTNAADITGQLALIIRGACTFNTKYLNAQSAGAIAIVVYNDGTAPDRIAPIVMGGLSGPITIPGVMISFTDGDLLNATVAGGETVNGSLVLVPNDAVADTIAGFSSRGPGHGGSTFKPDVTAPGQSIVSTGFGSGDGAITSSGTSFSAPHVSGLTALLRQLHPALEPAAIKALVQNGAVTSYIDGVAGATQPFPVARQGSGVIRADRSAFLTSYAEPGGVAFGRVNPASTGVSNAQIRLHNLSGEVRRFTASQVTGQTLPGVTVRILGGSQITLGPHAARTVPLQLQMDASAAPFDQGAFSQTEVDGWFLFDDGTDQLRVGYHGVVDPASRMIVSAAGRNGIRVFNSGGALGPAQGFTLIGSDGLLLNNTANAIDQFGFRTADDGSGNPLVLFGVATERPWESMSDLEFDINIDADDDGVFETTLVAADLGLLQGGDPSGQVATAVFGPGGGFLLFIADGDLNDQSGVLPFFIHDAFDLPLGFLPPGDTDFAYQLVTFDVRNGSFDVQEGSVDLAAEIGLDNPSFALAPGTAQTVSPAASGQVLWLFQNDAAPGQAKTFKAR